MLSIASTRFIALPLSISVIISISEKESFEWFVRLTPPRCDCMAGDEAYDFLTE